MNPHPPPPPSPPPPPAPLPPPPALPPAVSTAVPTAQFHNLIPHAPAANATPSLGPTSLNHPPYAEMIYSAITALKERNGSSKRAIAKYIERVYSDLPATHSALLTHHLKRLKNNGLLVMVKKSYKLPRSDIDNLLPPVVHSSTSGPKKGPKPSGRPRGRPRIKPSAQPVLVALGLVEEEPVLAKRGPGRPPKSGATVAKEGSRRRPKPVPVGNGFGGTVVIKKGPGRPPKSSADALGPFGLKKGPGRPLKTQANSIVIPSNINLTNVPRPRGRPKKEAALAAMGGGGGVVLVKRRGRPPKVGGGFQKPTNRTGRPVGRPKKNVSWAITEAPDQQWVAYGDLKRKLEYFQSKVKQAVGVLKPQLTNESAITAVAAIQELEALATMDISAPLREEAQQPLLQT